MLRINVPKQAQEHFWDEPPTGTMEFWAFRDKPDCEAGDKLEFYFNDKKVAEAIVAKIERPGFSECEHSGRFRNCWKIFWIQEDFRDLSASPKAGEILPSGGRE